MAGVTEAELIRVLEHGLPHVYGYLLHRVGDQALAEDLTSETIEGAFRMARRNAVSAVTVNWLIGIARHKLVDHWRRAASEARRLSAVFDSSATVEPGPGEGSDPVDVTVAGAALGRLNPSQRAALTLRYVDGLSVSEVAELLGRTVTATENLLARSKVAFRRHYHSLEGDSDG